MEIEVYADVVCPWCAIGERRLARALAERPGLAVTLHWRPFQLQPALPPTGLPWADFAARKFGGSARASEVFAEVTALAGAEGLTFDFARVASAPNTVDAHRLILLAGASGRQWAMVEALFAAYFAEGRDLNRRADLLAVAAGAGLEPEVAAAMLDGDDERAEVARWQARAEELGISGVPAYVLDGRYLIVGAQPSEIWGRVLDELAGVTPVV